MYGERQPLKPTKKAPVKARKPTRGDLYTADGIPPAAEKPPCVKGEAHGGRIGVSLCTALQAHFASHGDLSRRVALGVVSVHHWSIIRTIFSFTEQFSGLRQDTDRCKTLSVSCL
nr:MAG TPA: hypothetical protein [Caudoviricetes sp.]DAZ82656.1 MAG TPA: hypothetical protein [Caudoviricetes sp.]